MQPVDLHGSHGREYATGRGAVLATRELLLHAHAGKIANKDFVIQVRLGKLSEQLLRQECSRDLVCYYTVILEFHSYHQMAPMSVWHMASQCCQLIVMLSISNISKYSLLMSAD